MKVKSEAGFTYIDVMCAMVILTVGILALLSAIAGGVLQSNAQQQQLNAKQIAASTMESIMSVKETADPLRRLGWNAVGNVGSNPDGAGGFSGIFLNGLQPVRADAGPDQTFGTNDDNGAVIAGTQRRIVITDQCDLDRPSPAPTCATPGTFPIMIRLVQVTITYSVGTIQRQEVSTTVLTNYAAAN